MEHYYLPAEWEAQSGIQLTWPHKDTDWRPYLSDITETFVQLAKAVSNYEEVIIATPHRLNLDFECKTYRCPSNDTWARDHGAITLINPAKKIEDPDRYHLLDFEFNGWGKKFKSEKDNSITRNLYSEGAFNGKLVDYNDFVLEGGSIESDGNGTIMTTSSCLLAPNRNQPLTKAEIEQELIRRLNAKRVLWIDHGSLIGDDTDGHIDTIVRFAPNDTLLYMGCDDCNDPQYNDFIMLEQQLKNIRTLNGKPYNLLKLPMPKPIFDGEDRLPATYANFLIINEAVIVPIYRLPNLDKRAKDIIGSAFPDRKVIGIDASTIIRQHGSIHCLTMQFPKGVIR